MVNGEVQPTPSHLSPPFSSASYSPLHQLNNKLVSELKLFFFPALHLYLLLLSLLLLLSKPHQSYPQPT